MFYELRWIIPQPCRAMARRLLNRAQGRSTAAQRLGAVLFEKLGRKVASGPFARMEYLPSAAGSELCPKLLGTYEMELWPAIEHALEKAYDLIVDIGAAEGYYAVGLAMRFPTSRIVAFESNDYARKLLADLAALNQVERQIDIRANCHVDALRDLLPDCGTTLLICDVEGAEVDLLDPKVVPQLLNADILVELHDGHRANASGIIRRRFGNRNLQTLSRRNRRVEDFPAAITLPDDEKLAAMWENRSLKQDWFWITA